MTHSFELARRFARLRAMVFAAALLAVLGCDNTDSLNPDSSTTPDAAGVGDPLTSDVDSPVPEEEAGVGLVPAGAPVASASFAGGIPMGHYAQPTHTMGSRYNGGLRNIGAGGLLSELSAIRSRGARVVLTFVGHEGYFKDGAGNFSFAKWKARVDRFKGVNFSSFINDGTIIGHYLIDEPNDAHNWNGRPVPPSMVEEMARYSKQLWPSLTTIVRVDPGYLSFNHRYLDAAWAQYVNRKGTAAEYIRRNTSDAQARGLGLITGLNVLRGGVGGSRMSSTQVRDWGSTLLGSSYPCAFISWMYNPDFLSSRGMGDAMQTLRSRAQNRSRQSCRR